MGMMYVGATMLLARLTANVEQLLHDEKCACLVVLNTLCNPAAHSHPDVVM